MNADDACDIGHSPSMGHHQYCIRTLHFIFESESSARLWLNKLVPALQTLDRPDPIPLNHVTISSRHVRVLNTGYANVFELLVGRLWYEKVAENSGQEAESSEENKCSILDVFNHRRHNDALD